MAVKNTKRSKALGGVKALVVTASVAATLAGWAMLPANDPQSTVSADQQSNLTAQTVPNTGQTETQPRSLGSLPQAQVPQSSQTLPSPFTRSRSSR
jgi:hypothetical protein